VTVAAGLAVVGVVVSTSGSKKANKLALINIPEEFSGNFALEHDNGKYKIQGKIHKFEHEDGDWQIDGFFSAKGSDLSVKHYIEYTLKDDILVEVTKNVTNDERLLIQCMPKAGFIPYGKGKQILNNAVVVEETELQPSLMKKVKATCPVGSEISYVEEGILPWVVCGDYSEGNFVMHMIGEHSSAMAVAVEGMIVDVQFPTEFDMENCTASDPVTSFTESVMKGPEYETRILAPKTNHGAWPFKQQEGRNNVVISVTAGDCEKDKKCILNHGVGNAGMNAWDEDLVGAYRYPQLRDEMVDPGSNYQNNYDARNDQPRPVELCYRDRKDKCNKQGSAYGMRNYFWRAMDDCAYAYVMDTDTHLRGFNDFGLYNENWAIWATTQYTSKACSNNLFWMTHSMAGLVMQKAFCSGHISRKNLWWFQTENPWYGSFAANKNQMACGLFRNILTLAPLVLALVLAICILAVATGGAAAAAAGALAFATPAISAGMIVVWWCIFAFLCLIALYATWHHGSLLKDEVCVYGWRIGKGGINSHKGYGQPANQSIEFHVPWTEDEINTHDFASQRRPNYRICGNFPHGSNTDFERSWSFRQTGKFNEYVTGITIHKKHGLAAAQLHAGEDEYKWGDVDAHNNDDIANDDGDGHEDGDSFWNDGCVDATNCMNYALYAFDGKTASALRKEYTFMVAANHDGGSCRHGWNNSGDFAVCEHFKRFFANTHQNANGALPQYTGQGAKSVEEPGYWTHVNNVNGPSGFSGEPPVHSVNGEGAIIGKGKSSHAF
jgi:hypothetical protein